MEQPDGFPTLQPFLYAPAVAEDVLLGSRLLRRAFLETPYRTAQRGDIIVAADTREPPAFMIHSGSVFHSSTLPDGRRAILDILLPADVGGVDHAIVGRANQDMIAAAPVGYRALGAAAMREMLKLSLIHI